MIKNITIILCCVGLALGIWVAATDKKDLPSPPPEQPPAVNPFPNGLAALGFIEASSREVEVAAPDSGLVLAVLAEPNQRVDEGAPLFSLDARPLLAERLAAEAALAATQAELERLLALPREEDLPPLQARVDEAVAWANDAKRRLDVAIEAQASEAANEEEIAQRRASYLAAQAALAAAEAELARLQAGAWEQELAVARARVTQHQAAIEAVQIRIDRMTVRAPITGTIIKRNIEKGEFVAPGSSRPPFILANLDQLHVRAQVDEEDTPLLREGAEAIAQVRGPIPAQVPLRMLRIEPLAQPKTQITGQSGELIDTRVVEVIFAVDMARIPAEIARLFPGQAVDVFIRAAETPSQTSRSETPASGN